MPPELLVVGAGLCGLAAAARLAAQVRITLIDRLPVAGGITAGPADDAAQQLTDACREAGVRFMLGTTALRWRDNCLLVAGPHCGYTWLEGQRLVYAGGTRPSTAGELKLLGRRVAGVFPATVAHHLVEVGVKLGSFPLIVGGGNWGRRMHAELKPSALRTTIVVPDMADAHAPFGDAWWPGWHPSLIQGQDRVSSVVVTRDELSEMISCDALILAGGIRPMRNVEGAVFDDSVRDGVVFAQCAIETSTAEDRIAAGCAAADRLLSELKERTECG
jgi:D-hydroxyproline dehydrogenase subunit alpha